MREENTVFPMAFIKYRGRFDFNGLYELIFSWLKDHHYRPVEKKHKEKATTFGREIEIDLIGEAEVTDYVNYLVTFKLHAWDLNPVKDVPNMDEGRLEIQIEGKIATDPKERFKDKDKKLHGAMREFLDKIVLKRETEFQHGDRLANTLGAVCVMIRKFLNMDTSESAFENP